MTNEDHKHIKQLINSEDKDNYAIALLFCREHDPMFDLYDFAFDFVDKMDEGFLFQTDRCDTFRELRIADFSLQINMITEDYVDDGPMCAPTKRRMEKAQKIIFRQLIDTGSTFFLGGMPETEDVSDLPEMTEKEIKLYAIKKLFEKYLDSIES